MPKTSRYRHLLMAIRAARLSLLRRLLHLWVRVRVLPEDLGELNLDPDRPTFYVIDSNALTSLLIADQLCRIQGWHRPTRGFGADTIHLPRSYGSDRRYRGLLLRIPERQRHDPILRELIAQAEQQASNEVRSAAAEAAIKASEEILRASVKGAKADALVEAGLKDVRARLN